jgi:hypothetical protein
MGMLTRTLTIFISLILSINLYIAKKCGHDELKKKINRAEYDLWNTEKRFLQTTTWEPIRIYIDYTTLDTQTNIVDKTYITNLKTVLEKTKDALQTLIMVKRSTKPIVLSRCDTARISATIQSQGIAADLILFPSIDEDQAATTEASAAACVTEKSTSRPIGGVITFNKYFDFSKKNAIYYFEMLTMHETTHVLGFDPVSFTLFIDENGNKIMSSKVIQENYVVNGKNTTIIISPKALAAARKHFNCSTMQGIELEDQGGVGTAGSHWESRVMYGDYMIGESIDENIISEITLALLEDSGWYKVNYYTAGLFKYGKNEGCNFLNQKCIINGAVQFTKEFTLRDDEYPMCFAGRTAKGVSSLNSNYETEIDSIYKYFTDKKRGGYRNADFCPVATSKVVDSTWYYSNTCWYGKSTLPSAFGESMGSESYCFMSSLIPQNDNSAVSYKGTEYTICYKVKCDSVTRTYTINVNDKIIKCDTVGGAIKVDGFDGMFACADYNQICTKSISCNDTIDCILKHVSPDALTYDYVPNQLQPLINTTINGNGNSAQSNKITMVNNIIVVIMLYFILF